jgi:hypothetical protein
MVSAESDAPPVSRLEVRHLTGASLASEDAGRLVATLCDIETQAYGIDCRSYWSDRPDFLDEVSGVCLALNGQAPVGFLSYGIINAPDESALYLDSTAVVPTAQQRGVLEALFTPPFRDFVRRGTRRFFLLARTENPVIFDVLARAPWTESIFPSPLGMPVPEAHLRWARELHRQRWSKLVLEEETLIIRGAHRTGSWFRQLPVTRSSQTQKFFSENLRMDQGDAVLVVALVDVPRRPRS